MSGLYGQPFDQFGIQSFLDTVADPDSTFTDILIYRKGNILYLRGTDGVPHIVGSAAGLTGILPLANGGSGADLSATTVNSALAKLTNKVADGVSAVAFAIDNIIDLATAGAKLLSFRSAGTEKAAILGNGTFSGAGALLDDAAPAPTPTSGVGLGGVTSGLAVRNTSGAQTFIGDLGGTTTTQTNVYTASFELASNGTKDFTWSQGGSAVIADSTGAIVATIGISTAAVTTTGGQTFTDFSTTLTTANKLNVNASGGALRFENKTAGMLRIAVTFTLWRAA